MATHVVFLIILLLCIFGALLVALLVFALMKLFTS